MRNLNEREEQIRLVARFLLDEYGLQEIQLSFRLMRRTLGYYSHSRKLIQLSTHTINTKPYRIVVNTILHEIAHALTPMHGHDRVWKEKARELGALPRARANDQMRRDWVASMEKGL